MEFEMQYNGSNENQLSYFADADSWEDAEVWDDEAKAYIDGITLTRRDREQGIEIVKGEWLIWQEDSLEKAKVRQATDREKLTHW